MNNYNKAAVEVLEIIKYIDDDTKERINKSYIEKLKNIKDPNYQFTLNKEIPLYDNEFLDETKHILAWIFKDIN